LLGLADTELVDTNHWLISYGSGAKIDCQGLDLSGVVAYRPTRSHLGYALRALREQITSSEEPPHYYLGSAKLDTMKTISQNGFTRFATCSD